MRTTLIIGLLLGLPTAVLLALAVLAVLAGKLFRLSSRGAGPGAVRRDHFTADPSWTGPYRVCADGPRR